MYSRRRVVGLSGSASASVVGVAADAIRKGDFKTTAQH
jgi:hypothetical protein